MITLQDAYEKAKLFFERESGPELKIKATPEVTASKKYYFFVFEENPPVRIGGGTTIGVKIDNGEIFYPTFYDRFELQKATPVKLQA